MALAWTKEWMDAQQAACRADEHFNDEADGFDRHFTMHILADPERGVPDDRWVGFNPPRLDDCWVSDTNQRPESDYIVRGTYADWHAINEGHKGLVASLLDQSIELIRGNTSYIAMFVTGADRFYAVSRSVTDAYEGDYKSAR